MKKTRKFMVDGVEVSVTTSKIVTDNDAKSEEMRFLRYALELVLQIRPQVYDPNRQCGGMGRFTFSCLMFVSARQVAGGGDL